MKTVRLGKNREKSALNRHPWVFASGVSHVDGNTVPGEVVRVVDSAGAFLAYGTYNPHSAIALRLCEWDESNPPNTAWLHAKLAASVARRAGLSTVTDAMRLVFGESDGLPGVVADRYGDTVSLQISTAGAELWKPAIVEALVEICKPAGIYEKTDGDLLRLEGLEKLSGLLWGETPPPELTINENGLKFAIDIVEGQKTGFFLDQRANRAIVSGYAKDARVLDCFSYTGGFSVACAKADAASVTAVDSSVKALERLKQNAALNGAGSIETFAEDVFDALRRFAAEKRTFDLVILDPPKLAPTRTSLDKALRAYKDLAMRALLLLEPGGTLAMFSCSGGVSQADLQKAAAWGALDAGKQAQIVRRLSQDGDHPVLLSYPESEYLKGFVIKVI